MKEKVKNVVRKLTGVPRWAFLVLGVPLAMGVFEAARVEEPPVPVIESVAAQSPTIRRAIDGVPAESGWVDPVPFAVVVENSIDARPVSGIAAANLVFEAPAEAGITRFLALYADGADVPEIGPVRSARPYYVDWAEEFHALFAHVGGSPEALAIIPSRSLTDLNQFWYGNNFWRATHRTAPHNVYTSTELLDDALDTLVIDGSVQSYASWSYKEDAPFEARPASQEFRIEFSSPAYTVTWQYHPTTNEYVRWQLGELYRDQDGAEVRAKNIAVMATTIDIIDEVGRRRITTVGEGAAWVFRDGQTVTGVWKRGNRGERTRFFDEAGNEIAMNAGPTWVEVVGEESWLEVTE